MCRAPLLALLLITASLRADDGAASIAAGGLLAMKHEPRIVMAKEVLRIGPQRVAVDYDFRSDSDRDIQTLVAFPIASDTVFRVKNFVPAHELKIGLFRY